jgi:glutathione synthase/RimK-type ligase-like ATP-grasp enzyme
LHNKPFLCHFIDNVKRVSSKDHHTRARQILINNLRETALNRKNRNNPVLIFTRRYDPEADLVGIRLLTKGINYFRINFEDIPAQIMMRHLIKRSSKSALQLTLGENLDTSRIRVAWLRHFDLTELYFHGSKEPYNTFSFQQWHDAIEALQRNLKCAWINNPEKVAQATDRSRQLQVAKAVGFNVPDTLITNDPKAARDFYKSHDDNIVIKALHGHGVELGGKIYFMYTHMVTKSDLPKLATLIHAPSILQERISTKSELRITVVGDKVFPAKVSFPPHQKKFDDIHRYRATELSIEVDKKLPQATLDRCRKLVKLLGLQYAAIDFVVDKDDRPIFLEVNPDGDWLWIEEKTQLPISKAIANLITRHVN